MSRLFLPLGLELEEFGWGPVGFEGRVEGRLLAVNRDVHGCRILHVWRVARLHAAHLLLRATRAARGLADVLMLGWRSTLADAKYIQSGRGSEL